MAYAIQFPSPRGVELHKPNDFLYSEWPMISSRFRPLAGLSCINP